ncbi:MAG: hypothetical protein JO185_15075 [Acidobacteriaceae bacterium]|nr:hypothetical protein [Acidobacteriaceae bacterium]
MATTQMIQTDPTQAQGRWTSLSGKILEGGYELQDLLEATDKSARFKVRVLGDRELDSVALVFPLPEADIDRQVELWQNTRMLRHPNVSGPLGAGRLQLDDISAAYVVVRRADEALGAVLRERALTGEETGEALISVTRALEALHINGWAHGCLSPDVVLAVGDFIQLPAECARVAGTPPVTETVAAKYIAPENPGVNLTLAADVWCLGATLFEALTQKVWAEEWREEVEALPEPFATISLRCLETDPQSRCSLAEAVALYRGELKLTPRVRVSAAPPPMIPPVVIREEKIAPRPEALSPQSQQSAPPDAPVPSKPAESEQPKAKVFVQDTPAEPEVPKKATPVNSETTAPPIVAAPPAGAAVSAPAPALTAQAPPTNGGASSLPQAAAMAALAPEAKARTADTPSSGVNSSLGKPDGYTQTKPSIVARPDWGETAKRPTVDEEESNTKRLWIWGGILLSILALGLLWLFLPKQRQTPVAAPSTRNPTSAPVAGQKEGGGVWQTRTIQPSTPAPPTSAPRTKAATHGPSTTAKPEASSHAPGAVQESSHPQASKEAVRREGHSTRNIWRVVLYTYNRQEDAEHRAKEINARHKNLHAEVFSPSGGGSPFLVTTESRMDRDEAVQMRRRAIAAGMARDAYIQNYSK